MHFGAEFVHTASTSAKVGTMGLVRRYLAWISLIVTIYGALLPVSMWYDEGKIKAVSLYSVPLIVFFFLFLALALKRRRPVIDPAASSMLALAVQPTKRSWPVCCGRTVTNACGRAVGALAAEDLCKALERLRNKIHATMTNIRIEKVYNTENLEAHIARMQHMMNFYHALNWASHCCNYLPEGDVLLTRLKQVFDDLNQRAIAPALKLRQELRGAISDERREQLAKEVEIKLAASPTVRDWILTRLTRQATLAQVRTLLLNAYRAKGGDPKALESIVVDVVDSAVRGILTQNVAPALQGALPVFAPLEKNAQKILSDLRHAWHEDVRLTWTDRACKPKPEKPPVLPLGTAGT